MQILNKTEQIAHLQGKDRLERQNAIQDMLTAYRSTPNPATGVTPFEAMRGTTVRTKLDHIQPKVQRSEKDDIIDERDAVYKQKMKQNREDKNTGQGRRLLGDYVLVKQEKRNKWSMPYEPVFYIVHKINGSRITARRAIDEKAICRDISHFKLVNAVINSADDREITEAGELSTPAHPTPEKFASFPRYVKKPSIPFWKDGVDQSPEVVGNFLCWSEKNSMSCTGNPGKC